MRVRTGGQGPAPEQVETGPLSEMLKLMLGVSGGLLRLGIQLEIDFWLLLERQANFSVQQASGGDTVLRQVAHERISQSLVERRSIAVPVAGEKGTEMREYQHSHTDIMKN